MCAYLNLINKLVNQVDSFLLKNLFDFIRLHGIRRAELNAVVNHSVHLEFLGKIKDVISPLLIRCETGAIDLEIAIDDQSSAGEGQE